jgi:hypothetical protein
MEPVVIDMKPTHYKVVCISIYTSDLADLDAKVEALKARGLTKMSRSQLIRLAVGRLDIDAIETGGER